MNSGNISDYITTVMFPNAYIQLALDVKECIYKPI